MRNRHLLGLVVLLLVVSFCSRSRSTPGKTAEKPAASEIYDRIPDNNAGPTPALSGDERQLSRNAIEEIVISPSDPVAASTLSVAVKTDPAELAEGVELRYVYWVNAAIALESGENTFSLAACKKNDLIYVDAVISNAGEVICRKRSLMVKILNSSPAIKNVDFPEIKGPGTYAIKVNAIDADGDPLNYSLDGEGLPEGATVDSSGVVKLTLGENIPENIVFWVVVKDDEDGETRQEIKMNFTQKKVPKQ